MRTQVKTFDREDEQALARICAEQLPVALANAAVADRERMLQKRSLGLLAALRQAGPRDKPSCVCLTKCP